MRELARLQGAVSNMNNSVSKVLLTLLTVLGIFLMKYAGFEVDSPLYLIYRPCNVCTVPWLMTWLLSSQQCPVCVRAHPLRQRLFFTRHAEDWESNLSKSPNATGCPCDVQISACARKNGSLWWDIWSTWGIGSSEVYSEVSKNGTTEALWLSNRPCLKQADYEFVMHAI